MRLWQIFDADPLFGRFWRVFLTQILTRIRVVFRPAASRKEASGAVLSLGKNLLKPPLCDHPAKDRVSLGEKCDARDRRRVTRLENCSCVIPVPVVPVT
jgi:hypothetical protein